MRIGVLYNVVDKVERGTDRDAISDNEIVQTVEHVISALRSEHEVIPIRVRPELLGKLNRERLDIIFNLCEGYLGKVQGEHWMAGYLELLGIPYTGSGPLSLGMCLNKMRTKQILVANRIPTPKYQVFFATSQNLSPELRFPLIVKPIREDASVGITSESVVTNKLDLFKRIDHVISRYDQPALVEEYIDGRELNVSVIGNGSRLEALPISEILFDIKTGPRIVDYEAKWIEDSPSYGGTKGICPADLPRDLEAIVKRTALEVFRIMGCFDYARVDFRLKDSVPYVLEVNPNPGINTDSGFARSCKAAGMDHPAMVRRILSMAMERYGMRGGRDRGEDLIVQDDLLEARRPRFEDVGRLHRWFNDPDVSLYMDSPGETVSNEDIVEDVLISERTDVDMILFEKATGRAIGFASLYGINESNGDSEMSMLIGSGEDRGKGYGKRIVRLVQEIAFGTKGLYSITASITCENVPSIKALKACGFREVGVLREYHVTGPERHDEMVLHCIRSDAGF